ncbi:hypothetical protein U5A82_17060 [Sphingobium sp. CR2-8]|uniref:hypothetical protein n=1 Tax=Sphingobium sp. CR2-8 TaxID=1306534 RepID=UPI002DBCC598|nr:hypothetical protein [Sphingobium sp. CR2-8]MEC3912118.1 hypothetical protein [Sphingobium sp. CR2-8]
MNDYVSRSELTPVDRTAVRAASPVQAVQPVAASRSTQAPVQQSAQAPAQGVVVDEDVASVAEYAEIHAQIADILAGLQSATSSVDDAAGAIQAMIPRPMVLVPLPRQQGSGRTCRRAGQAHRGTGVLRPRRACAGRARHGGSGRHARPLIAAMVRHCRGVRR